MSACHLFTPELRACCDLHLPPLIIDVAATGASVTSGEVGRQLELSSGSEVSPAVDSTAQSLSDEVQVPSDEDAPIRLMAAVLSVSSALSLPFTCFCVFLQSFSVLFHKIFPGQGGSLWSYLRLWQSLTVCFAFCFVFTSDPSFASGFASSFATNLCDYYALLLSCTGASSGLSVELAFVAGRSFDSDFVLGAADSDNESNGPDGSGTPM